MTEFTNEEKDKLLTKHGYEKTIGYAMDYEPPETNKVIISLEEIRKCIGKPAEVYYWKEDWDNGLDLEEAWEDLIEETLALVTWDEEKVLQHLREEL